jgi:hypothetical protein
MCAIKFSPCAATFNDLLAGCVPTGTSHPQKIINKKSMKRKKETSEKGQ